jgi:1-deoxy-D-xylulose-5-phosphate reductoisomerase
MPYLHIPLLIEAVLEKVSVKSITRLEDVLEADRLARSAAEEWLAASHAKLAAKAIR